MPDRRDFLKTAAGALSLAVTADLRPAAAAGPGGTDLPSPREAAGRAAAPPAPAGGPLVVSTWKHGLAANDAAWEVLAGGGRALDAVETGVRVSEADPAVTSVGYGGLPDRDGRVTLDASIMEGTGRCGSVACLEHVMHPVSVARRVMEKTPHVMLVGEGALEFALAEGFARENLLTPESEAAWLKWLEEARHAPRPSQENHDTIGMLARDRAGGVAGACTTSGMAFKLHGRVGDSPIIGAALFVDDAVGGACATGHGEFVMQTLGGFLVVELMRQGRAPQEACEEAIDRIVQGPHDLAEIQVGYLAMDREGRVGAYALRKGFEYARCDGEGGVLVGVEYRM